MMSKDPARAFVSMSNVAIGRKNVPFNFDQLHRGYFTSGVRRSTSVPG